MCKLFIILEHFLLFFKLFSKTIRCTFKFKLQLHGAIYRPDSFVLMLRHCVNLKAIRYESRSSNRIAADKSHYDLDVQ